MAGDQAVVDKTEDDLQRALWKLNTIFRGNSFKIFTAKTNVKAFKDSEHMTAWIVPDNKVNEQIKECNKLERRVSIIYEQLRHV